MARKEAEAIGVFRKEHCAEIAVSQTYFTVFGNRAGDTERLKTYADFFGCLISLFRSALYSDSRAYCVSPYGVLEADRLSASYYIVAVDAVCKADFLTFFDGTDPVFFKGSVDFVYSSFISFK